jgi:hypothetical protein
MFSNWRRQELEEAARTRSWKQTPEGYEMLHQGSLATLTKKGKEWVLSHQGREKGLGRKASFDTAEKALQGLGEAANAKPTLVLKKTGKTSWIGDETRWSVEAREQKKGPPKFYVFDLHGEWKAGPFGNWSEVIASLEKKTKRKVRVEGVLL